ncbi:MAG: S41 family peptidase [Prevotellaceae bacterium]|jgi:hypothetical protein|nr:S41 family peptidase [Prevotellaceae bacterium]
MKYLVSRLLLAGVVLCTACKGTFVRDFSPQANFDALWTILDTKYCYFDAKQIDWNGVKALYEPQLAQVRNEVELFDLLAEMLDTLQDGHVNLYSSFDVSRCRGWFENYPANFDDRLIYSDRYLGNDYRQAGGFQYTTIASGEIGYIRYASFSNSFSGMNYIDKFFASCKGIIIDVRNNGGGMITYSSALAACFFREKTLTGYIRHKTGMGHNDFSSPQPLYADPEDASVDWSDRRVVVLTNRRCYSATNEFVCQVKQADNVTVIGGMTGGGGGMPLSSELPCGWMVRFSAVPMFDAAMQHIEFGIAPDIEIALASDDISSGYDTLIEYAVNLLVKSE